MSIEDNVNARRDAEEVMDLIGERAPHFWECLASMAQAKAPQQVTKAPTKERDPPMTEDEAIKFERVDWPWRGLSFGMEIGRVDPEYIAKCVDGTDFDRKLRRYVKSERFKRRLAEHDDAPSFVRRREE